MIRRLLGTLATRVQSFWDLEDPEERIDGSGEAYLDPAYTGVYTAQRQLRALSKVQDDAGEGGAGEQPPTRRP